MLFREDKVARADAEAIRKGVGFYRWTHDLVEITGKDALEVLQKIYISGQKSKSSIKSGLKSTRRSLFAVIPIGQSFLNGRNRLILIPGAAYTVRGLQALRFQTAISCW